MYAIKTPKVIQTFFKDYVWKVPTSENELFLTFDDGPTPGVTNIVLDILKDYNAKATFFCLGKNVVDHPKLMARLNKEGHSLGNHTYNHFNGWKTNNKTYFRNILKEGNVENTRLFRPPYGKITRSQASALSKKFSIIMWDVLSGDFDLKNDDIDCAQNVIQNSEPGSILVFHDSIKAKANVLGALPRVLKHFSEGGYVFKAL